jgi:hypothetical protein
MCRKLLKSESTIVENGDGQRTLQRTLQWRSTGRSQSAEYYAARSMRGPTLDRDRRDTGYLVLVNESDTLASCLANESIKNCQHEENRSAANAHEYNRSDYIKHDIWASYCIS